MCIIASTVPASRGAMCEQSAQCRALLSLLSSTDCNAGQVSTQSGLFVLPSPPPPWEYCRTDLIAATLEQLSTNRTLELETELSSLDEINKMMEFDFMTCGLCFKRPCHTEVTWDFLLNLDNISNLHSPAWKIVWECLMILCLQEGNWPDPDCLCVVAEGRWQIGLKMCVYSVLTESDSTFTPWNTTYLCHSNWQSGLFVYLVYCYPCSVLLLPLFHCSTVLCLKNVGKFVTTVPP